MSVVSAVAHVLILLNLAAANPLSIPQVGVPPPRPDGPTDGKFHWACIGDSWASGVAYLPWNGYDDDAFCRRVEHAYSALMEKNSSWAKDPQHFLFKACSGSRLSHMAKDDRNGKPPQIEQVEDPQLIVMTAGGNNGRFFEIATNCVYHQDNKDYGPPYERDPKHKGLCAKSLDSTLSYIEDTSPWSGLGYDLRVTLDDILKNEHTKKYKEFFIYVTGYVHFWNVDTEYCNECVWSVNPGYQTTLSKELRVAMNDAVQKFNERYAATIAAYKPRAGATVRFVDISHNFNGHRFCEEQNKGTCRTMDMAQNVYIWSLSVTAWDVQQHPKNPFPSMCKQGCTLWDFSVPGNYVDGSSEPSKTRVMHPKEGGHFEISQHLYQKFQEDKLPGTVWAD